MQFVNRKENIVLKAVSIILFWDVDFEMLVIKENAINKRNEWIKTISNNNYNYQYYSDTMNNYKLHFAEQRSLFLILLT